MRSEVLRAVFRISKQSFSRDEEEGAAKEEAMASSPRRGAPLRQGREAGMGFRDRLVGRVHRAAQETEGLVCLYVG